MPIAVLHKSQYESNKNLLSYSQLFKQKKFIDWYITISFYSAVHLVEGYLDKYKSINSENHKDRLKTIKQDSFMGPLFLDFNYLYNESIRARYKCSNFDEDSIDNINKALEKIENKLKILI